MSVVRIEQSVSDFEAWKQAFDGDAVTRTKAGVLRYDIFRPLDDPDYVFVDLEFTTASEAGAFVRQLEQTWTGPTNPKVRRRARLINRIEHQEF